MNLLVKCQEKLASFLISTESHAWSCISDFPKKTSSYDNEFLLLWKPEVLYDLSNKMKVFEIFEGIVSNFEAEIIAVKILSQGYVQKNGLIDKNYPTLNQISRKGFLGLHPVAKKQLLSIFQTKPEKILGGDQFLEIFPGLTPFKLCEHSDKVGTKKIGSGIYACQFDSYTLVNGFYPYQRSYLSNGTLLAFIIRSPLPWQKLRHDFVGAIHPSQAAKGSLRRTFYELGYGVDSISKNGFHISPGPIEGAMQIEKFFFDNNFTSHLTSILKERNLLNEMISKLFNNPITESRPLFELTEDLDTSEALKLAMRNLI